MHALLSLLLLAAPHVVFSTYAGGRGSESAAGIAFDPKGDVVVCGYTTSTGFTWLANPKAPSADAFVAKLAANGGHVRWTKRFSSVNGAFASAVAVDAAGNIYVTGNASSDFPITADAAERVGAGGYLAKLSPDGDVLYATFLGYAMGISWAIAVDARGNATIAGTAGDYLAVARVSADGRRIDATKLGDEPRRPFCVAVDDDGNVYVGNFESRLTKFDAAGRVVFSKRLDGMRTFRAICATRDAVWLSGGQVVMKLDRGSGRVLATLSLPSAATAMTALRDGGVALAGPGLVMVLRSDASIASSSSFGEFEVPRMIASDGGHRLALFGIANGRHVGVSVVDLQ